MSKFYVVCGSQNLVVTAPSAKHAALRLLDEALAAHLWVYEDAGLGALPGSDGDRFRRVPTVALLVLGPAMGFFFVIFLPFIGFALFAREIGHRVAGWFGRKTRDTAKAANSAR